VDFLEFKFFTFLVIKYILNVTFSSNIKSIHLSIVIFVSRGYGC
jgi:hypothetical protein